MFTTVKNIFALFYYYRYLNLIKKLFKNILKYLFLIKKGFYF